MNGTRLIMAHPTGSTSFLSTYELNFVDANSRRGKLGGSGRGGVFLSYVLERPCTQHFITTGIRPRRRAGLRHSISRPAHMSES